MKLGEFRTELLSDAAEREQQIAEWKKKYNTLVQILGTVGAEVSVRRTVEQDDSCTPPRELITDARHIFVFPPQEVVHVQDTTKVENIAEGHTVTREEKTCKYRETAVISKVRVYYNDSDRIQLNIRDVMPGSVIPDAAMTAIEAAFQETTVEPS